MPWRTSWRPLLLAGWSWGRQTAASPCCGALTLSASPLLPPTGLASVLQSPDGNWVALGDGAGALPRLLAKPKSGAFQALEAASGAASAYEEMGSDSEEDFDWSEALSTLCPRPRGPASNPQPQPTQAQGADQGPSATSASSGLSPNPEAMCSDSETSSAGSWREAGRQARLSWLQRKAPGDPAVEKMRLQGELDVNFNPQAASRETSDSSEPEGVPPAADRKARRGRRARVGSEEPSEELSSPNAHCQGLAAHQVIKPGACGRTHTLLGKVCPLYPPGAERPGFRFHGPGFSPWFAAR